MSCCKSNFVLNWKKNNSRSIIPSYKTDGSAGFDFHAVINRSLPWDNLYLPDSGNYFTNVDTKTIIINDITYGPNDDLPESFEMKVFIPPKSMLVVDTGLSVQIPNDWSMEVRPRSGLAVKSGITIVNSPGTIDSDYTGNIMIVLYNLGKDTFFIKEGDRIAQGVMVFTPKFDMKEVESIKETKRGNGGFGSTGS